MVKAAYSCGDLDKSYIVLQAILREVVCLSDQLDAQLLIVKIRYDQGLLDEAYKTSYEVLSQLGESVPDQFSEEERLGFVRKTAHMLAGVSEESLIQMKEMERKEQFILRFYMIIATVSFHSKPNLVPFFHCQMNQITMTHGFCKLSLLGKLISLL